MKMKTSGLSGKLRGQPVNSHTATVPGTEQWPPLPVGLTTLSPHSWFPAACFPYVPSGWLKFVRFSSVNGGVTYDEMYRSSVFCSMSFANGKNLWIHHWEQDTELQKESSHPFTSHPSTPRQIWISHCRSVLYFIHIKSHPVYAFCIELSISIPEILFKRCFLPPLHWQGSKVDFFLDSIYSIDQFACLHTITCHPDHCNVIVSLELRECKSSHFIFFSILFWLFKFFAFHINFRIMLSILKEKTPRILIWGSRLLIHG